MVEKLKKTTVAYSFRASGCISVGYVTQRSKLQLAALASAVMPSIAVAGVRSSEQTNATDEVKGIDIAVVQDAGGRLYDVYVCDTKDGRKRLQRRVHAAQTMSLAKEPAGLGLAMDTVLTFASGEGEKSPTSHTSVLIMEHHDGESRPLNLLTLDDCASVGTAIGAVHRLRPDFLREEQYPTFSTGQIRSQLIAWIKRLRQAGHVPTTITRSWSNILETDGLWSFSTCPVHGGFSDGDVLFSGSTITAITNWQDMQVNDPARDLAWIFAKLDDTHRNAVLSAYGRMLGSRLDDLIMLRANLWVQMEQVGEFIEALNRADNAKIMQFKAQVERLAHQLEVATGHTSHTTRASGTSRGSSSPQDPSTITVGTLLGESERRRAAQLAQAERSHGHDSGTITGHAAASADGTDATGEEDMTGERDITGENDRTGERDITGSAHIPAAHEIGSSTDDSTADRPVQDSNQSSATMFISSLHQSPAQFGSNADPISDIDILSARRAAALHVVPQSSMTRQHADQGSSDESEHAGDQYFGENDSNDGNERGDPQTIVIPLLEREERALRDAQSDLDENEDSAVTGE